MSVPAPLVDRLSLQELAPGTRHHLRVWLVADGLADRVRVPAIVVRGRHPGPVVGVVAALHGNELNGIPVLHRLFEELNPSRLKGAVVGVLVVNVPGFLAHERTFFDGRDLNHLMPGNPDGNTSSLFAHRVLDRIISHFDYLVDLHTASFGRVNSLYVRADLDHPVAADIARRLRPQILLHNPASDRTLRGTAMERGIPAVTLEIGNPHRFNARYIKQSVAGLRGVLGALGLTAQRRLAPGLAPVVCTRSQWMYTQRGGLLEVYPGVTDRVLKGQVVARLTNIYGELVDEYRAPEDGVVIGHSVQPVGQSGARILHLGRMA